MQQRTAAAAAATASTTTTSTAKKPYFARFDDFAAQAEALYIAAPFRVSTKQCD